MAKTRETKKLITKPISQEEAEGHFAEYADADARAQKLTAQMDIEITRVREKYADDLTKLGERKEKAFEHLQHFATTAPELFTKRKSLELAHGVLGFRTGTPSLKTLKGFTWESAKNLVKEFLPDFVRTKEEVDKEGLLAERENEEITKNFTKCGIKVEQSETFFVEPKKEAI